MKTGKFKDKITITVKVSVGCDEPWPPPTEDKTKLAVLQGLRATLQIIGESYESEILSKVQAQLGEPDNWRNLSDLDGWHQRNNWPNPIAAMTSMLEPDIKWKAEVESIVQDLCRARIQLNNILEYVDRAPSSVTHGAIRHSAKEALELIGDDK